MLLLLLLLLYIFFFSLMSTTINGDESYSLLMYDKGTSIHPYIYVVRTTDRASNILLFTNRYRCIPCSTESQPPLYFFCKPLLLFWLPVWSRHERTFTCYERTNERTTGPSDGRADRAASDGIEVFCVFWFLVEKCVRIEMRNYCGYQILGTYTHVRIRIRIRTARMCQSWITKLFLFWFQEWYDRMSLKLDTRICLLFNPFYLAPLA